MSNTSTPSSFKKIYLSLFFIGIGLLIASSFIYKDRRTVKISYREVPVQRGDLDVSIQSTGNVEPKNRFDIKTPIAGRIDEVLVKEGQLVKKGEVLAWMSSTERASLLDAARAQGPKALKRWEKNYRPTPILAPISGTIIHRSVEPGQSFTPVDTVLVMSDLLTVKAQVDETDISQVRLKGIATIILDAYPSQEIRAHVEHIAYDARTVNNVTTYIVDVLPEQTPEFMRSGMTANVTFSLASKKNVLSIPNDSLRVQDDKYSVLIKTPDQPLEKIIKVGLTDGKSTEVVSGLSEGDTILAAEITPGKK